MFAAFGTGADGLSVVFSSKAAVASGLARKLGIGKKLYAVQNTRGGLSKKSMIHNAPRRKSSRPKPMRLARRRRTPDLRARRSAAEAQRYFMY